MQTSLYLGFVYLDCINFSCPIWYLLSSLDFSRDCRPVTFSSTQPLLYDDGGETVCSPVSGESRDASEDGLLIPFKGLPS